MDDPGLVDSVDGLGQGVVVAFANAATDGSTPVSERRSVHLIETYWADSTGHRNTLIEEVAMTG